MAPTSPSRAFELPCFHDSLFFASNQLRCSINAVKSADIIRMRLVVSGRVQGVGFRYSTVDEAHRLALHGWVRNTRDGSVEILAEGPADMVERLVRWCESGPRSARVTSVERELLPAGGDRLEGFGVRY
jgi:acylphosphatase